MDPVDSPKHHQKLFDDYIVPAIKALYGDAEIRGATSTHYSGFSFQEGSSDKVYFVNAFHVAMPSEHRVFILTRWGRRGNALQHKTVVARMDNAGKELRKVFNSREKHGYSVLFDEDCRHPVSAQVQTALIGEHEEI